MKATLSLPLFAIVAALVAFGCGGRSVSSRSGASLDQAPSRFAKLDGLRVHYKSLGRGPEALVFVHGWAGDMEFWRFQVPTFAGKTRVIAIDLPGHGRSDKPDVAYTMDLFARAIDAVLRDARVNRAVLVGHSMGTPVVRQFYRLFPSKTMALVAADGALRSFFQDRAEVEKFVAPYKGPGYKEAAARFVDAMFPNPGTEPLRDWVRTTIVRAPQHVMVGAFQGTFDPAIWKDDKIEVPLLVIKARSPFWTPDYEAFVRALSPEVEYRVMEGVGHFLMLEKPKEFNEILSNFLWARGLLRLNPS